MPPQNSIVFELVPPHLNTLFRAGASDFVTAISAWWTIENWDIASKITPCGGGTFWCEVVGHFGARWWDILVRGGGTFWCEVVGHFGAR
jgi:hypothetical protein